MRTLAIDCSTEACSIALFDKASLMEHRHEVLGRGHAEHLIPMISTLPEKGRADRILVALGPGSFTGIRIGIASARALGLAWKATVLGYPTLALIAAMARQEHGPQPVDVAMHGGHGEWFFQAFHEDGSSEAEAVSLKPQAAVASAKSDLVAGSQAEALIAMRGNGAAMAALPDARYALMLSETQLSPKIQPTYGRAPDAKPATKKPA